MEWVVRHCRPLNIFKDAAIKEILKETAAIGWKYGANVDVVSALPHPTTAARNVKGLNEMCFKNVKGEIAASKEKSFGLTTDLWTDNVLKKS